MCKVTHIDNARSVLGQCGSELWQGHLLKWLFQIPVGLMSAGSVEKTRALKLMRLRF